MKWTLASSAMSLVGKRAAAPAAAGSDDIDIVAQARPGTRADNLKIGRRKRDEVRVRIL